MGLNSYFVFSICSALQVSWEIGFTCCVFQGIIFTLLGALGLCDKIQEMVPLNLKLAITVGIGLFQAFIGFQICGLVQLDPTTMVALGDLASPTVWMGALCLLLITFLLVANFPGAMLVGIWASAIGCWVSGAADPPVEYIALPRSDGTLFNCFHYKP